tara:strand:+ start:2264 stop:2755 length:492 start_codon:yes stop_codon:yes gene_type:complete
MAMVLNNIEELIEKYNNAETTLKEEAQLKAYFANDNVEPHLEHYKPLFHYFSLSQKEQYTKDVPLTTKKTKLYQWISVAAVAVLMLGLVVPSFVGPSEQEKQEALLVYNQTMEALSLVSIGINEGKQQFNNLALVSDNINEGVQQVSRLGEFNTITNRILKNK